MKPFVSALLIVLCVFVAACRSSHAPSGQVWTQNELMNLKGKTRAEVQEILGKPNGFYTRSAEGRWHYSNVRLDQEGAGPPKKVWVVIYFSQFEDQRASLVEIHDHEE